MLLLQKDTVKTNKEYYRSSVKWTLRFCSCRLPDDMQHTLVTATGLRKETIRLHQLADGDKEPWNIAEIEVLIPKNAEASLKVLCIFNWHWLEQTIWFWVGKLRVFSWNCRMGKNVNLAHGFPNFWINGPIWNFKKAMRVPVTKWPPFEVYDVTQSGCCGSVHNTKWLPYLKG